MAADPLLAAWAARVEATLESVLPQQADSPRLVSAMRHATLGGGKRLRPLLAYAAAHVFNDDAGNADAAAAAVELVHAFSLVHDDLPAMDDDDLRRGKPTVHVQFDEATAILAGDSLHALAFGVLVEAPLDAAIRIELVRTLARASGPAGMCAGQALDMAATGQTQALAALEHMHALKTGALIRAAVRMGALSGSAPPASLAALDAYAIALGLAFQIRDDILDVEGDGAQLGKTAGKDAAQGKSTYPGLLGLPRSRQRLDDLAQQMDSALVEFGSRADALRQLAQLAVYRVS